MRSPKFQETMVKAVEDPDHPHHKFYATLIVEYTQGKPKQSVEHGGTVSWAELVLGSVAP